MLDKEGFILTLIMGFLIFIFSGLSYLLLMLAFLVLAVSVTKYEYPTKRELGIYEHERSWENVLSNGLVPTLLAVFSPVVGLGAYLGALAAITADKFASELGVLSGKAFFLHSLKPVKPGPSGAVSGLGLWMSLLGGLAIGLVSIILFSVTPTVAVYIGLIGFLGSLIDSLLGILEERGIGTKATTNLLCSLSGALLGYFLISL